MANIVFELSGDEQKLVTALLRGKRAMDDLEGSTQKVRSTARDADADLQRMVDGTVKHAKGFTKAMGDSKAASDSLAQSVGSIAAGFAGLQTLVGTAADVMENRLNRVKTLADQLRGQTQNVIGGLADSGNYELMPQVRQQIKQLSADYGVDAGQLSKTFREISTAGIPTSQEGLMEVLGYSARMSKVGLDATSMGKMMLNLKDIYGSEMSTEQAADFAVRAQQFLPGGMDTDTKKLLRHAQAGGLSRDQALQVLIARSRGGEEARAVDSVLQMITGGGPSNEEILKSQKEVVPEAVAKERSQIASRREQIKQQSDAIESEREAQRRNWQDQDMERAKIDALGRGPRSEARRRKQKLDDLNEREERVATERTYEDKLATLRNEEQRLAKKDNELSQQKILAPTDESWRLHNLRTAVSFGTFEDRLGRLARQPELLGNVGDRLSVRNMLNVWSQTTGTGKGLDEREAAFQKMRYGDAAAYWTLKLDDTRAEESRRGDIEGLAYEQLQEKRRLERMDRTGASGFIKDAGESAGLRRVQEIQDARTAVLVSERDKKESRVVVVADERAQPARESGGADQRR